MIEITNRQKSPVQIVVKSRKKLRAFTTIVLPGRGSGKNRICIEDEAATDYIGLVESFGLISTRMINE